MMADFPTSSTFGANDVIFTPINKDRIETMKCKQILINKSEIHIEKITFASWSKNESISKDGLQFLKLEN